MNKSILILKNEADAILAKRLLKAGAVPAAITARVDERDGCKKGLVISSDDLSATIKILREAGVFYTVQMV